MTTYYLVFELVDDPRQHTPVEVHTDRYDAESSQLLLQQDRADEYNKARTKAFKEGRAFSGKKSAADYSHRFRIEEV